MLIDNVLVSPWVLIVWSIWLSSISFPMKNNTFPVVLHRLSLVCRFVDDLFVPDFPDFENFMYLDQDSFGSSIYPNTSLS